jgi:translation initiation factor 2-alpha kinase 4
MLLEHDPDKRPSALQLSTNEYLPETLEDEYVKEALPIIGMIRPISNVESLTCNIGS